jgi:hypothetical protein
MYERCQTKAKSGASCASDTKEKKRKYDASCVSDAKRKSKNNTTYRERHTHERQGERRLRCSFDNESQKGGVLQKCKNQSFLP